MTARSSLVSRWLEVTAPSESRTAIVDDDEEVTFAELGRRARGVAAAVRSRGLANERIAMLVTQGSRWVEAFYGSVLAGAAAVPLSPLHPETEQRWFVEASGARALVVSEDLEPRVTVYAGSLPVLRVEELRADATPLELGASADDDVATILYTSGTTGKPKGALLTHGNLYQLASLVADAWGWTCDDALMHTLPLHHLHGLGISLFVSLLAGGKTRMMAKFDAARVWDELGGCSVLMGVPTMHKKLVDALDAADEPTRKRWSAAAAGLRLLTSGSAALPSTLGERLAALTGEYPLERFGMTEIGVGMTNPVAGPRVPGTCGKALPGMQIRIVDEQGRDAPPGQPGEIWIKGPTVFRGYDGLEQATRDAFTDGWFRSGDTATWTKEGYAKILGRTSVDILKSGGYKLSALEIEEVLREHDGIGDVAVVGIPDDTWGEIAVAAIVTRPGVEPPLSEDAVRSWAKERIAAYKVPKRVLAFDDFPRNAVGKVLKPELAKEVARRLRAG